MDLNGLNENNDSQFWLDFFEKAPCGFILTDLKGYIFKVNRKILEWTAYAREELEEKKKFQDLLPIGGKLFYETQHITLIKIQDSVYELNYELVSKSGERKQMLVNSHFKKDEAGNPKFIYHAVSPYSDRKKFEAELVKAKKNAEAAAQAKTDFLSTITHEIRTPIHGVIGMTDFLLQEDPRQDQMEMLNILRSSSLNLLELVNNILDLNKIEAGEMTIDNNVFNLRKFLTGLINSFRYQTKLIKVQLELNIEKEIPKFVYGDALKIGQVLNNLIGNSLKFTKKGSISLTVKSLARVADKQAIGFEISDTGIGMSEDEIGQIFNPFTQANRSISTEFGGTGLGLPISQKILQAYGSELKVSSKAGKGSVFSFDLKLAVILPADESLHKNSDTFALEKMPDVNLLVVDDNHSNLFVVSRYLEKWKVNFNKTSSGEDAIRLIQKHNFDLVLLDLKMPLKDGYETIRQIRSMEEGEYKDLPVIAFSASASKNLSPKMKASGFNDFIPKPFNPLQLHDLIKKYGYQDNTPEKGSSTESKKYADPVNVQEKDKGPSLDFIRDMLDNETPYIKNYLKAAMIDVDSLMSDFSMPVEQFNKKNYSAICHKANTMITFLNLNELKVLFAQGKALIANGNNDEFHKKILEIRESVRKLSGWLKTQAKEFE